MKKESTLQKRCAKQRFEGVKLTSNYSREITQKLLAIAMKIISSARNNENSSEIIRNVIIDIANIRDDYNV